MGSVSVPTLNVVTEENNSFSQTYCSWEWRSGNQLLISSRTFIKFIIKINHTHTHMNASLHKLFPRAIHLLQAGLTISTSFIILPLKPLTTKIFLFWTRTFRVIIFHVCLLTYLYGFLCGQLFRLILIHYKSSSFFVQDNWNFKQEAFPCICTHK